MERSYYGQRLMDRREKADVGPFEMAAFLGIQPAWYFDLEAYDELFNRFPLSKLALLLRKLDLTVEQLFTPPGLEHGCARIFDLEELLRGTREFLAGRPIVLPECQAHLASDLEDALSDPNAVWEWTAESLRAVCDAIGWDWLCVDLKPRRSPEKREK